MELVTADVVGFELELGFVGAVVVEVDLGLVGADVDVELELGFVVADVGVELELGFVVAPAVVVVVGVVGVVVEFVVASVVGAGVVTCGLARVIVILNSLGVKLSDKRTNYNKGQKIPPTFRLFHLLHCLAFIYTSHLSPSHLSRGEGRMR